jgi:hypothetical protein
LSPKGALLIAATTLAALSVGGIVIVGGGPSGNALRASAPPAFASDLPVSVGEAFPAKPHTTLHLPTTLHVYSQNTGGTPLDKTHTVYYAAIAHPSTPKKVIGTAAFTCVFDVGRAANTCEGALALHDGLLLFTYTETVRSTAVKGRIVGGTGFYAGAHGTLSGHDHGQGKNIYNAHYSVG